MATSSRVFVSFSGQVLTSLLLSPLFSLLPLQTGVFQKMRRRLTVTGASETIDGVAKMSVSDEDQRQQMVRINNLRKQVL